MKDGEIVLEGVPQYKQQQAEEAEQKESIKNFRRFIGAVLSYLPVCFIPVIKWQKRLKNASNPEKGHQACNEHEPLKLPYLVACKYALCEKHTYYKEDNSLHQLKELHSRYVVY